MFNLLAIPAVIETGVLKIATVDIIVLVALLIAAIIGYIRGFMRQILSVLGFFASLVLAFVFCDNLANYLFDNVPFVTEAVKGVVTSMFGSVLGENFTSVDSLLSALAETNIPSFLQNIIADLVVNSNFDVEIIDVVTKWALTVISFLGILIVANLLFIIVKVLCKFITNIPLIKSVDKTLGIIFSVLKVLIIAIILCSVLSIFMDINQYLVPGEGVESVFNQCMKLITNLPFIKNIFG